jgi:REP element-mobilizing transposase RayT
MTRLARMVVSGLPHHVTQRGNRREPIFFEDGDQEIYRDLLGEQVRKAEVEVWAYCLMPNHVHLILNPRQADGLGRAVGEAHRRYTNFINARGRWTGHLFQEPFRLGGHGRIASDIGSLLCQPEPCPGAAGGTGRGLALVECSSTYQWSRRRAGDRSSSARSHPALC